MKNNARLKAEKFWDKTAKRYDKEEQKDAKVHQEVLAQSKVYLKSNDFVLDFGCGTGIFSNEMAQSVGKIHGIDISSKMMTIAESKAEKRKISNVQYTQATIFNDSLKHETFDVILAYHIIHLIEEQQHVFRRMRELLKPGGIIISVTPCMGEKPLLNGFFSFLTRIGLVPKIAAFKQADLQNLFEDNSFTIIENKKLAETSNQYFIVAKKT